MRCAHCLAVAPTPLTSQWLPTDRGCLRAPGTGSCTHAAHLTVAAHGPGLFEGSRDRLPKLALKMLYESRRNHVETTSLDARRHLKPGSLYYVCLFRSIGLYGHLRRPIR